MDTAAAAALVYRARPNDDADQAQLMDALDAVRQLASWVEAQRLRCTKLLTQHDPLAEVSVAQITRTDPRDMNRLRERQRVAETVAPFGEALQSGAINSEHLDELGASLRRVGASGEEAVKEHAEHLLGVAERSTPEQFRRTLRRLERRIDADQGIDRFRRQQASWRLRHRVDADDGMHQFTLRLDPLAGLKLEQQVNAAVEALFHDRHPERAPSDPLERYSFLGAHALMSLIEGKGSRPGRPELIVVVDTRTGSVDWGRDADLPPEVLNEVARRATIRTITVGTGHQGDGTVVIDAPGDLDLGRSTRLASAAQRRVLRALYPTCSIPGCHLGFDKCTAHHVHWWRHGGETNLDNLTPLCHRHHHLVHEGGWHLSLQPDRTLVVTFPDGRQLTTGPPRRQAG